MSNSKRTTLPHRADRSWAAVGALLVTAFLPACEQSASITGEPDLDALPRLPAGVDMRIGSVDDPDIGFSRISGVDVDRDGRIYVFEALDMQIRVYSPNGDPLHRIGRRGQGPGEFERVPQFGVVGDTVWTLGSISDRLALFDRSGTLLSTARAQALRIPLWGGRWGYVLPRDMRADGLFTSALSRVRTSPNNPAPEVGEADSIPVPRLLFDASGAIVDTLGWDDSPPPGMASPSQQRREERTIMIRVGGRTYMVPQSPTDTPRWIPLHDGKIIVDVPLPSSQDAVLTVTRVGLERDTVYHRRLRYTPSRYPTAELDALAAGAASRELTGGAMPGRPNQITGGTGSDDPVANQLRAAMEFPELRPATRMSSVDEDERLWIQRYEPPGLMSHWVLLDREGRPLGQLELPGGFRLMWSRGDSFWGVEPDDLDVPWLVRYRMER